ncbi:MAG TPA: HAMP domain-containing sensor histidine kinase [Oscillatoriaceae cyanobacterium]
MGESEAVKRYQAPAPGIAFWRSQGVACHRSAGEEVEAPRLGCWEWDVVNDRVLLSPEMYALLELSPRAPCEDLAAFLALFHPDQREGARKLLWEAAKRRQAFEMQLQRVHADGRMRLLRAQGSVLEDAHASRLCLVGTCEDVSEAPAEATSIEALEAMRRDFVNAVSHELRTPLTAIVAYVEFLEEDEAGNLTLAQQQYLKELSRGARRLERLVQELLDFGRFGTGTFKLECTPGDLALAVAEIVDSFAESAREAGVRLTARLKEPALECSFDAERIGQVLINLVGNALKFTGKGGEVVVSAHRDGDRLVCEVHDTGTGIAEEDLPRLFQRFSQLPSGQRLGGMGIGLAVCRAIIEAHGGEIGVCSRNGEGSTFWFTLPVERA